MAKVEIQIPKDLKLTRAQLDTLQKGFQKQLVETLKGARTTTKSKSKLMVISVRAKNKNEVV